MDDNCIGFKEVNSKKQTRLPDEVIDELDIEVGNENSNGVAFYQNDEDGEIILRRLEL
jgi:bifunctional DNA-binding transcriptional regulator/antitoxin component of YhaV-PrlF toxin-antitoxin module